MKPAFWMTALLLGVSSGLSSARAGDVYFLDHRPPVHGKLTLDAKVIHVDAGAKPDVRLRDVLEADFNNADFHVDYFCSRENPSKLPANWQGHDIGQTALPGSFTYDDGTLTISTRAVTPEPNDDRSYFVGQPWADDDGQWTARFKDRIGEVFQTGLMLRAGLDPDSPSFLFSLMGERGHMLAIRQVLRDSCDYAAPPLPCWIRLSRYGGSFMVIETSTDGKIWDMIRQSDEMDRDDVNTVASTLAGVFVTGNSRRVPAQAVLDDITFTPLPSLSDTLPPGVLLSDGTFLIGGMRYLDPAQKAGTLRCQGVDLTVPYAQIADVIWRPVARRSLENLGSQTGAIMRNGDFLLADFLGVDGGDVQFSSMLLGSLHYESWDTNMVMCSCVLHPLQPKPSDYEIRFKDSSNICAGGVTVDGGQISIQDVSGVKVPADQDEIAQFWAGSAHLQKLMELPWKATESVANPAPAVQPVAPVPAGTGAAAAASVLAASPVTATATTPSVAPVPVPAAAAPAAPFSRFMHSKPPLAPLPPLLPLPAVRCWEGNNAEQIMAAGPGTAIDFPLKGKFSSVALRVAILSETPNATAVVQILADGREVARTAALNVGSPPTFVRASVTNPRTITLNAQASGPDVKILYIDPVVLRD